MRRTHTYAHDLFVVATSILVGLVIAVCVWLCCAAIARAAAPPQSAPPSSAALVEITVYTTEDCAPCRRLRRDVLDPHTALGNRFLWRFVECHQVDPLPKFVRRFPTLAWNVGKKGWYVAGWAGPESFLLTYEDSLRR